MRCWRPSAGSVCMAGTLKTHSTLCDTNHLARRLHAVVHPMFNHRVCDLHQMLQSITAYVCIARYSNGRAQVMQFQQHNGDGVRLMVDLFLSHKNYFVSSDVSARVLVVVRNIPAKNMMWSSPQHVATVVDLVAVTQVGYY